MRSQFAGKPPTKVNIHSTAPLVDVEFWAERKNGTFYRQCWCFGGWKGHQNHNWEDLALTSDGGCATRGTQGKTYCREKESWACHAALTWYFLVYVSKSASDYKSFWILKRNGATIFFLVLTLLLVLFGRSGGRLILMFHRSTRFKEMC